MEDYSAFKIYWQSIPERPDVELPDRYTHWKITIQHEHKSTELYASLPKTLNEPSLKNILNFITIEIGSSLMDENIYTSAYNNASDDVAVLFCKSHRELSVQREAIKRVLGEQVFNYLFRLTHLPYHEKTLH